MKTIPSYRKSWISDITRTKTSLRNHYQLSTDNLIPKHFRTFLYRMFQNVISDNPPKIQGTSGKIHGIGRFTYIFMVDFWMAKFLGKYIARFGPMDASHSLLEDLPSSLAARIQETKMSIWSEVKGAPCTPTGERQKVGSLVGCGLWWKCFLKGIGIGSRLGSDVILTCILYIQIFAYNLLQKNLLIWFNMYLFKYKV